jgi:hypothetical protein
MTPSTLPLDQFPLAATPAVPAPELRPLPSGRSVVVRVGTGGDEEVEVRGLDGTPEVRIRLTADGPVVQVRGGRLELEAADTVAIQCRRFEVHAPEGIDLNTAGDVRITGREVTARTADDIHLNARTIRLNC